MKAIQDDRISLVSGKWHAQCCCGKTVSFSAKNSALQMLKRQRCRACRPDYRSVNDLNCSIYKNANGNWCSTCSGCGKEQAYTRKEHAKQSSASNWQCKSCVAQAKGYSASAGIGNRLREYNRFRNSALSRGIKWELTVGQMFETFNGFCVLTGWPISIAYKNKSASLDRINSELGYTKGNIQWVHAIVNMCKNKYKQDDFIFMCHAIAAKHQKPKGCSFDFGQMQLL